MSKAKKRKENRLLLKLFICVIYLVVIATLLTCSYDLFKQKQVVLPWSEIESVEDYTYIDISKMSEKFAFYEETNIGLHFAIEEEKSGLWHTYILAINEKEYEKEQRKSQRKYVHMGIQLLLMKKLKL
jgi:hypothetical protein